MATGVLPLCLGAATKVATFLLASEKTYTGTITLGVSTDTLDAEGAVIGEARGKVGALDSVTVRRAMAVLTGSLEQVPPMFSAIRQGGKRLYELARAGQDIERPSRAIEVRSFELRSFDPPNVGSRCLVQKAPTCVRWPEIWEMPSAAGRIFPLSGARRPVVSASLTPPPLEEIDRASISSRLISPAQAVSHLPALTVGSELITRIGNGLQLRWEQLKQPEDPPKGLFSLLSPAGVLLAVCRLEGETLAFARVFQSRS